jgi:hypothetical protein
MKLLLEETVDGKGDPVKVWHSDYVGQNLAVSAMYLRATAFLVDRGWAMAPFNLVANTHKVIWVESADGTPMGGVIYEYHAHNKQGWIVLIFTDEQFRGRRVYSILQRNLEDITIQNGGTSIASLAHKDNESRLKAGTREGMNAQFLRLYKDLAPELHTRKAQLVQQKGKPWNELNNEKWAPPGAR